MLGAFKDAARRLWRWPSALIAIALSMTSSFRMQATMTGEGDRSAVHQAVPHPAADLG